MSVVTDTIEWFSDGSHWSGDDGVPIRLLEHLGYSALTVGVAAAVAIPLGLWIGHTGRMRGVAVSVTGAMRAMPTLGLLTWFALISGIGLTAPILALVILAIPPLLAGAYSGLESVDRQTIDAARAMGMTERQILTRVEIPLALPLLVGGVRSAVLQVVATATVAAYVGLGGLGRFIIDGQALSDYPRMVSGSILVIVLALALDAVFVGLQKIAVGGRAPIPATSST
jgi:osmoprotectant transport system permease protein